MKTYWIIKSPHTHKLFDGDSFICGKWKPYLIFDFVLTTHQFNPTPFFRWYQDRKIVRDKVWELQNRGWGCTKFNHYLVENNKNK